MMLKQSKDSTKNSLRPVTVLAGTVLGMGVIMSPVPEGFSPEAWKVLGVALWMAFWWLTEALPVSVTALLPLIVFPVLGLSDFKTSAAPYAHPLIFLFMGGFMIAKAIEAWNLHNRIALLIVRAFGTRPDYLIAGFMLATATLSMWVSNTATTVMMLPIAISIISVLTDKMDQQTADKTATALLLGVAYSASIGGVGTLVGSPPNALLAAFAQERFGVEVGFAKWMAIGLPVVLIMLPLAWLLLTRVTCPVSRRPIPGADEVIRDELKALGPMTIEENLALAALRGQRHSLRLGLNSQRRDYYRDLLKTLGLGLEDRLTAKVELLSGGQRQSLALIMAIITEPAVLLLDEHCAALDPKTAGIVMDSTVKAIEAAGLTTLMVTHNMQHAIEYGNRLIMLEAGQLRLEMSGAEKTSLDVESLVERFHITDDKILLS